MTEQEYIKKITELEHEVAMLRHALQPFVDLEINLKAHFMNAHGAMELGVHRLPTLEDIQGIFNPPPLVPERRLEDV